ncbi:MAG: phosphatidate cytidylyltransferase [Lewinella sp.]|uniref:phosphatidate cytidylyltransferase n=1 Tax=Lewinella sp. TaxID=2004506 RepID=UPI003D6AC916
MSSMQGLLRRGATAAIFVVVMLAGLFGGPYSFVLLFAIITGICLWEYLGMVLIKDTRRDKIRKIVGLIMGILPVVLSAMTNLEVIKDPETFVIFTSLLFSPFIFMAFIYELFTKSDQPFANIAYIVLGIIYIGVPFALLDFIAFDGEHFYANTVFGILVLTWMNDTGAYLVGSRFGKTPLLPRVSPKKTWEGSIGGGVITFISALILYFTINELRIVDWLVLAAIVSIFASLGDLVESLLKRSVDMKDSGTLLPGHGGLLDRFDGFIFCLPFAAAYLLWIR